MLRELAALALFATFVTPGGANFTDDTWTGFTAKWPVYIFDGLFTLPQNYSSAVTSGWTNVTGATNSSDVVAAAYRGNCRYIIFFNTTTGYATGIQVGFPVADVANLSLPVDYDNFNGITLKELNGEKYYTAAIRFRKNDDGSHQIWVEEQGKLIEIPTNTTELVANTPWEKKNCIPTMGTHYYRVNSTSTSDDFYPWSFLGNKGTIVGFLFQAIGSTSVDSSRKWNEDIPSWVIPFVISDAPLSLLYNVWVYGVVSVHSWLHAAPTSITCD